MYHLYLRHYLRHLSSAKIRSLYRYLYATAEILHLGHGHTSLLKPFTDFLEASTHGKQSKQTLIILFFIQNCIDVKLKM